MAVAGTTTAPSPIAFAACLLPIMERQRLLQISSGEERNAGPSVGSGSRLMLINLNRHKMEPVCFLEPETDKAGFVARGQDSQRIAIDATERRGSRITSMNLKPSLAVCGDINDHRAGSFGQMHTVGIEKSVEDQNFVVPNNSAKIKLDPGVLFVVGVLRVIAFAPWIVD
jgi:hypothetical protein